MGSSLSARLVSEFGDFQTPRELTRQVCSLLARTHVRPASIIEPTSGTGNFLLAALDAFPSVQKAVALDINPSYVQTLRKIMSTRSDAARVTVLEGSFFHTDWPSILATLPDPLLVIGNPPWVTNSHLGTLGSANLPQKSNFQRDTGIAARTGKSNFDISEWILTHLFQWANGRRATVAMLCKTTVARKLLSHSWKHGFALARTELYPLDAASHFGASVHACLLICTFTPSDHNTNCLVYENIEHAAPAYSIGVRDGHLVSDIRKYEKWKHLGGIERYRWRSGIKHDCVNVMELHKEWPHYRNGFGETVDLEEDFLFPMLKSSALANGPSTRPDRWMLVTQRSVSENTSIIKHVAPKTWHYLQRYGSLLDRRASSVYRNRSRFSVFGVGEYTFATWKVAISGFYKKLSFKVLGAVNGKPTVLDDTGNFVACKSEEEARFLCDLLNSDAAREFFEAYIFWDSKRPITVELLRRLDLLSLARERGEESTLRQYLGSSSSGGGDRQDDCQHEAQPSLFAGE